MLSKEPYIAQLQNHLEEWCSEIDVLKQDALRVKPEIREDYVRRIADLRIQCDAARKKIEELRNAQETGWESLREDADQMWHGLKQLFSETKEAFNEGQRAASHSSE